MKPTSALTAAALVVPALLAGLAGPAGAAARPAAASPAICASSSHPALAARIGRAIETARRSRVSFVAVQVDDPGAGLVCRLDSTAHFDSASVVKATILGSLVRRAQQQHRPLTRAERALAWAMITRSDNNAASALWAGLGRARLQHFLDLAGMTHTVLGPGGAWGLTRITAADETRLLWLLLTANRVLGTSARDYALALMADVIPAQRWGVPGRGAAEPGRARQERLAAAGPLWLADQQHRRIHRAREPVQHRRANPGQPDHGLRGRHRRGDRPDGQPGPEPGRSRTCPALGHLAVTADTGRTCPLGTLLTDRP